MGTNYYIVKSGKTTHLGKASCGWRFAFQKTDEVYDEQTFQDFIKDGVIIDEYDRVVSVDELNKVIERHRSGHAHLRGDFISCDFT